MRVLKFLMFNSFVKRYLNSNSWFLQWNKRIKSTNLEMLYTLSIFFPFLIITMFSTLCFDNLNQTNFKFTDLISLIPFCLMMIALLNKDFFGGQSAVHRLLGYQVIDVKTNKPANKMKCMLRNVTAPLWPIEAIFLIANPKRRLGDFIAGTCLVEVESADPELILNDIRNAKFDEETKKTLFISTIWIIVFIFLFDPRLRPW